MPVSVIIDLIPPRDMRELTKLYIYQAAVEAGPYTLIETITGVGTYPEYIDQATTDNATSATHWFMVRWQDTDGVYSDYSTAVQGGSIVSEIMASLDDINANLDGTVVFATFRNTAFIQISVARVIRGYLSKIISLPTLFSWETPEDTPEIIREIAAKLIAAQLYFNETSRSTHELSDIHFAQRLYDAAMALLNEILTGEIILDDVTVVISQGMTILDGFPIDDTDRAFTLGMPL